MKTPSNSPQQQSHTTPAAREVSQGIQRSNDGLGCEDHPAESMAQTKWQDVIDTSPRMLAQRKQVEGLFRNPIQREEQKECQSVEGVDGPAREHHNSTGIPDPLKARVESLSGLAMDDVKVHYNSDRPAQLHAHAYAQGTDIHLASGQEKHLPHEAWHVVQQKQGRVKPTMQMKGGVNENDDLSLEKEADVIGAMAMRKTSDQKMALSQQLTNLDSTQLAKVETIQRRTILLGRHSDDYATMKVLTTLSSPGTIQTIDDLDGEIDEAEDVFIVGHGYPGGMWADGHDGAVNFDTLADAIFDVLPDNWTGKIMALTCRAAVEPDKGDSAIQKLKDKFSDLKESLEVMGIENITIIGGKGFSYGAKSEGAKGQTGILKSELDMFYSDAYDKNKMAGKLKLPNAGRNAPQSARRKSIGTKGGINYLNPKDSKEAAKAWVDVRELIETEMIAIVKDASKDGDGTVGANTVENTVIALKTNNAWKNLLTEQENEFTFYEMFMPSDNAFESLTIPTSNE